MVPRSERTQWTSRKKIFLYMIVNSSKMKRCFKYCLETRSGCCVLEEPDHLMALIFPTKDKLASCLLSSFSLFDTRNY